MANRRILWVDNKKTHILTYIHALEDEGYVVEIVANPMATLDALKKSSWDLIIMDQHLPHGKEFSNHDTGGGYKTGLALARRIRSQNSELPIVCCSIGTDDFSIEWFETKAAGYWPKASLTPESVVRYVQRILGEPSYKPKIFIVHGHDSSKVLQLKNYLQNTLSLGEPIILHEKPQLGRTILEKFEQYAITVDIVFVLLTPDDKVVSPEDADLYRGRQNVIFELGFFFGALGRHSGRVVLLHEGPVELPSDILGLVNIDISEGIDNAQGDIRREIETLGFI